MTPERFRACLAALYWSQRGLAGILGKNDRDIVRRWASGDFEIPQHISSWLETLARVHEENPPPE